MKNLLFFLLSIFILTPLAAQFGPQQIISTNFSSPSVAVPADINDDGFIDILTYTSYGSKISWFQNMDGEGNFGNEQVILDGIFGCTQIDLFDLDGDGDDDILYTSNADDINWIENLNSSNSYGPINIIDQSTFPYKVTAGDFDNDGDLDIVANLFDQGLYWFENIDNSTDFGPASFIDNFYLVLGEIRILDFDNDGDEDILTSHWGLSPGKLVWYENNQGAFESPQTIYEFPFLSDITSINDIFLVDINNDELLDLLIKTQHDDFEDYVYWLERLDDVGNHGSPNFVFGQMVINGSLESHDIDNDGDNDILMAYEIEDEIIWFENTDSEGTFSVKQIISSEVVSPRYASAADLNGDGALDVISASFTDNKLAWYEFGGILGVGENDANKVAIYPNPVTDVINVENQESVINHRLYNALGQQINCTRNGSTLSFSKIPTGIYFLSLENDNGQTQTFKVIKK